MQWIKAHLNVVIAGGVGLLALVALILGVILPDPAEEMRTDESVLRSLQSARGATPAAFDDLFKQQSENARKLKEKLQQFANVVVHKPLPPAVDLFPKENLDRQNAVFEFKGAFRAKQQELLSLLKAGDQPTEAEIAEEAEKIARRKAQEEANKAAPANRPTQLGGPALGAGGIGFPLGGGAGNLLRGRRGTTELGPNATPEERVREDPLARASVKKARRAWCYATLASFDPRPAITEAQRPRLEDMWYAQVSLWVQEDILRALHQLNEKRAQSLPKGETPWVGNMPFKHLLSFNIGGYVPPATGGGAGGGRGGSYASNTGGRSDGIGGPPPMSASAVVSKRGSTQTVDVIQFTIEMVIEAAALPEVIDQISSAGFYTVLQVNYEAVPPNTQLAGYIYGSKPVIRVWLLGEGSFLRTNEAYAGLMPETVKKEIASGMPVGGSGTGGGTPSGGPGYRPGGFGPGFDAAPSGGRRGFRGS